MRKVDIIFARALHFGDTLETLKRKKSDEAIKLIGIEVSPNLSLN
jgi:hypothetical protein